MIHLRILGSVDLRTAEGNRIQSVVAQPKRLCLLAYLVVAKGDAFVSRETLLGLFGPESDEARARAALSQALHYLRRSLGSDSIESQGNELVRIDDRQVWCDVVAFEAALDAGDVAGAVELYRGDLLEGLFLDGVPEFERWLDGERARLKALYTRAMAELERAAPSGPPAADAPRPTPTLPMPAADPGVPAAASPAAGSSPPAGSAVSRRTPAAVAAVILLAIAAIVLVPREDPGGRTGASAAEPVSAAVTPLHTRALASTGSQEARQAYAEGAARARAGRHAAASMAYERAIEADSTFAHAWYRLSAAAAWSRGSAAARAAAQRAFDLRDGLSEPDRQLITGNRHWHRGEPAEAERMYRILLDDYPAEIEGWMDLGEVLFHYGPPRGFSIRDARGAWQRVLAFDPADREALIHLARIAAREGDYVAVDSLVERALAAGVEGVAREELTALRVFTSGAAARDSLLEGLEGAGETAIVAAAGAVARFAGDPEGAARLTALLTGQRRSSREQRAGYELLAFLEIARGRTADARQALARTDSDPIAAEWSAYFATLPFLPLSAADAGDLRERLLREGSHPLFREYLLGLLELRLGEPAPALARADALASRSGTGRDDVQARTLARGIRAYHLWQEHDDAAALRLLSLTDSTVLEAVTIATPNFTRSLELYLTADILARAGRDERALAIFSSLGEHYLQDAIFLAPAHLQMSRIYRRRGQQEAARRHYARFVELWSDADPQVRAWGRSVAGAH